MPDNLIAKIKQIQALQAVETPWTVHRLLGKFELTGDMIWVNNGGDQDHGSVQEFMEAAEWIVNQLGGTVKWPKETATKEEKKMRVGL